MSAMHSTDFDLLQTGNSVQHKPPTSFFPQLATSAEQLQSHGFDAPTSLFSLPFDVHEGAVKEEEQQYQQYQQQQWQEQEADDEVVSLLLTSEADGNVSPQVENEYEGYTDEEVRVMHLMKDNAAVDDVTDLRILKLHQIVHNLIVTDTRATKRDIYYRDVQLFKSQAVVDRMVDSLCRQYECTRQTLRIHASPKGVISGSVLFKLTGGTSVECNSRGSSLIPLYEDIESVEFTQPIDAVLVVEKCAVFSYLVDMDLTRLLQRNILLVCGKGYPDLNTQEVLCRISRQLSPNVKFHALVDGDAYGIDIMRVYQYGSKKHRGHLQHLYKVQEDDELMQLQWMGLRPSQFNTLPLDALLPLTQEREYKLIERLMHQGDSGLQQELGVMLHWHCKAEIQALYQHSDDRLVDFLVQHLQD